MKLNVSKTIIILLFCFLPSFFGCSAHRHEVRNEKSRRKEQLFIKKERKKDDERLYKYAVKRQKKIQSKETQKEMKRLQRKADIFHGVKKESFLRRWFKPKRKKGIQKPGDELLL
ncbi:MAG: hypothetical protein K9J13_09415 [Saprospiraceae bacterium]|nr:hypothetical protein [Saprospiraceae bacterium]